MTDSNNIGNNYKWDAAFYANNSTAQLTWAKELLQKLNLKGNERLLDIGCGDGKITAEIAASLSNGTVTGIDSSSEMISFAKKNFPEDKHKNLSFALMDVCNINFKNEFDVIFSNATLHWIKDHIPVLKKVFSALKPGGRILFQMGGKGNCQDVLKIVGKVIAAVKWKNYFDGFVFPYGFYGDEEYKNWLSETGFIVNQVLLIPKDMQHNGKDGLKGWFRSTWLPYIERIPEELQEEFIDEVIDGYLEIHPIDSEGKTHVKMMRLQVEAGKL